MHRATIDTSGTPDAPPIQEITEIINSLNIRKTPGHDLIEIKMIREAWPVIQFKILGLFNRCLEQMTFPKQYKKAHIKVLLKSEDKNEADPKSIPLFPVTGKILERAIAGRLKGIITITPAHHRDSMDSAQADPLRTQLWNYNRS